MFKKSKKGGSTSMILFIGLMLFQLFMYTFIFFANQDVYFSEVGSGENGQIDFSNTTTNDDIEYDTGASFLDGFNISVFFGSNLWINIVYNTIMAGLTGITIYGLIRGL